MRSFVTFMDNVTLTRVLVDGQGLFLTTGPDAAVSPIVEAVESALD